MNLFLDPVLQAPTIASMLMCLASALVGVMVTLKKRSLIGEALSHASYPGVVLFAMLSSDAPITILIGAFLTALLGGGMIYWIEKRCKVSSDAALCFTLSTFLGVGVLLYSAMQALYPLASRKIQIFLYGQAATMVHGHIILYGALAIVILLVILGLFSPLQMVLFDPAFAKTKGLFVPLVESLLFCLTLLAIIVGIRSVGVILMAGMLIAPAISARQWTHHLPTLFILAGLFGMLSAFFGNYVVSIYSGASLPTGPMIVIVASTFCLISLLVAPKRGALIRAIRIVRFRSRVLRENIVKATWKQKTLTMNELREVLHCTALRARWSIFRLGSKVRWKSGCLTLTDEGLKEAKRIVRYHRLFELYLSKQLGYSPDDVHLAAEEMEHILTPEMEQELTELLDNPKRDPHEQIIPEVR